MMIPPAEAINNKGIYHEDVISRCAMLTLPALIHSTAFFAWASRLMLTPGEPFLPEQQG